MGHCEYGERPINGLIYRQPVQLYVAKRCFQMQARLQAKSARPPASNQTVAASFSKIFCTLSSSVALVKGLTM